MIIRLAPKTPDSHREIYPSGRARSKNVGLKKIFTALGVFIGEHL
jgi:hypothetical protein